MSTRFARETGRNWSRFVPHSRPDVLVALQGMRRAPRWSAAFDYYTAHRARCMRPVALPAASLVVDAYAMAVAA